MPVTADGRARHEERSNEDERRARTRRKTAVLQHKVGKARARRAKENKKEEREEDASID